MADKQEKVANSPVDKYNIKRVGIVQNDIVITTVACCLTELSHAGLEHLNTREKAAQSSANVRDLLPSSRTNEYSCNAANLERSPWNWSDSKSVINIVVWAARHKSALPRVANYKIWS